MRTVLKAFLKTYRLDDFARERYRAVQMLPRRIARVDKKIINGYLPRHHRRKLHLGCGANVLDGWLNSDILPVSNDVLRLDIVKPFPFDDNTFDYVFNEHLIEHVPYVEGQRMLEECFRVLKDGGKLRISTPDLSFLISLYQSGKSDLQKDYIKWATDTYVHNAPYCEDTFVINNFVRDWGHKFIYDEKVLRYSLEKAGFASITRCDLNESTDEELRSLENETRSPEGFLRLESFTLEATKQVATGPG